jgi:hypothetical protein
MTTPQQRAADPQDEAEVAGDLEVPAEIRQQVAGGHDPTGNTGSDPGSWV